MNSLKRSNPRHAGVLVPLFSLASTASWGIGEISDIARLADWLTASGLRTLQLLPVNELGASETSPYSALSAMAIDPQFVSLGALEDFDDIGGEGALESQMRARLDQARAATVIDYRSVRSLKQTALRRAFQHFRSTHWRTDSTQDLSFHTYVSEQAWWLDEYALFRAIRAEQNERPWTAWPAILRDRVPHALQAARARLAEEILYRKYVQWVAGSQWRAMRQQIGTVALFGDLPFMVSLDSADVWARQTEFQLDTSVGAPPDAFSDTGQDWGMPAYHWETVATGDFAWLRDRGLRAAALYDGYRVDHVVGFYRTYFRRGQNPEGVFTPATRDAQIALGERVLGLFKSGGSTIIAEDLGVVPDFVRSSLDKLEVPGYKVMRWERAWESSGQPFHDPAQYPASSVATSGTHDTEPLVVWWQGAAPEERAEALRIPAVAARLSSSERDGALEQPQIDASVRDALLAALYGAGSDLLILPVHDVFGWSARVNQPGTVSDTNWTWRMPWPVDRLLAEPEARERALVLAALGTASNRTS